MIQTQTPESINNSPWLFQLRRSRAVSALYTDMETEIAVIGGGIAGVSTAYFILENTKHKVALIEAGKIAHGATGHNAGQLVTYFETPFKTLVKKYGLELASDAQAAIESSWGLLDGIFKKTNLRTPKWIFTGYAASKDVKEVMVHIKNNNYRIKAGLSPEMIMVAEEAVPSKTIPPKYNSLFAFMPHQKILDLLETDDKEYIAALPGKKGCMNSALFCEELIGYLIATYPDRFILAEETPVHQIALDENNAVLSGDKHTITAQKVILCTNGFEKLTILNKSGKQINKDFHKMVRGSVGYMAGYLEDAGKEPAAISYLPRMQKGSDSFSSEPYFYLTRRPFELERNIKHNLICIGGPESLMDDTNNYHREHPYPNEAQEEINKFLQTTFRSAPKEQIHYQFKWHGLMGYTPTGLRVIGPDPINKVLMYNLGCNGVGLMHSLYGGFKISEILQGKKMKPSLFDPKH